MKMEKEIINLNSSGRLYNYSIDFIIKIAVESIIYALMIRFRIDVETVVYVALLNS